ncbi:protein kinase [Limtongia smithiae]|uniref:protein kinase n=1 Tax=Limtongia smithiae TaxID=1125753 RepID=UPI0034CE1B54
MAPSGTLPSSLVDDIKRKIERERSMIQGAKALQQSTNNPDVKQRSQAAMEESQRNIQYLQSRLDELTLVESSQSIALAASADDPSTQYNEYAPQQRRAPAAATPVVAQLPRRLQPVNTTQLDIIRFNSPYLEFRIKSMMHQVADKLMIEDQYKAASEKMVKLYSADRDRRNLQEANLQLQESQQRLHLLGMVKRRYQDMHIAADEQEVQDIMSSSKLRQPMTGHLKITVLEIQNADHAATNTRNGTHDTTVRFKIDDITRATTRPSRNDRFADQPFDFVVTNANEAELTVYDKSGNMDVPIAIMWIRLSDIAEDIRHMRAEATMNGWGAADATMNASRATTMGSAVPAPLGSNGTMNTMNSSTSSGSAGSAVTASSDPEIVDWFVLEPTGKIKLSLSFIKNTSGQRRMDNFQGLGRQGAIRQGKQEVDEVMGHRFVPQQFYNVMRCAFCGEFLKYSSGYQCEDCKLTCHKKCHLKVVTRCMSRSSSDTLNDPMVNHEIPHRFEPFSNISPNWCCHCGYILPFGKKNARRCTECALTCHADCVHLVPDYCGMTMEMARNVLDTIQAKAGAHPPPMQPSNMQQRMRQDGAGSAGGSVRSVRSHGASSVSTTVSSPSSTSTQHTPPYGEPPTVLPTIKTELTPAERAAGAAMKSRIPQDNYTKRVPVPDTSRTETPPPSGGSAAAAAAAVLGSSLPSPSSPTPTVAPLVLAPPKHERRTPSPGSRRTRESAETASRHSYIQPAPTKIARRPEPRRKVGLDDFHFLAVLGKGNFGKVMLAEAKGSRKLYAIKVMKKEYILENDGVESLKSEKSVFVIANKEQHPFLLNVHSCFQTETRVYFVMDYINGGDLMWHIQKNLFSARQAKFYAAEVLLALKYLHEAGVIYRDLKLDNILLTLEGHIKIADYGLCKENMFYGSKTGTFCGTPELMAPEIIQDQKYGREVDWWAFGVLIYQMILGQSPFKGNDEQEIFASILRDEPMYRLNMDKNTVMLLQQLMTRDPTQRLGSGPTDAEEIMRHPYFADVDWDAVYARSAAPPFVPEIESRTDTSNFDSEFTNEVPVLTPVTTTLTKQQQEQFRGFSLPPLEPL